MSILVLISGLVLFVCLVIVHEFGHFVMARRGGVEVEEFGIGFPPRIWKKHLKSGFDFTINALPLGGFVKLKGENDADKTPGSFGAARLSTKIKIMLAGVVMNLLAAFVLFTLLALIGMPTLIKNQFSVDSDAKIAREVDHKGEVGIDAISKGGAADAAGLKSGDVLVSIGGIAINDPDTVLDTAKVHASQPTDVVYRRGTQTYKKSITFGDNKNQQGYLGITTASNETGIQIRRFTWSAPIVAIGFMKQATVLTFKGLGTALKGLGSTLAGTFTGNTKARQAGQTEATQQVSGPVGIFVLLKDGSLLGYQFVLMIIAIISLTLAIINVLPIPALDGGRLFVTLLFRAARRPLRKKTENLIHGTGFAALMLLFVLITIVDVKRFF